MATEAELEQALLDVDARRRQWNADLDTIQADANADSTRRRGRPLPPVSAGGDQIPAAGVSIDEVVNVREDEHRLRVILPADVPWQNLANHLDQARRDGNAGLDNLHDGLMGKLAELRRPSAGAGPVAPRDQPGKDPKKVYPWIDFITDIIAYVLVFYGLVAAAQAFGFFTILIGVGLLALTGILSGVIINPIRSAIKVVFHAVLQILIDLVEFFITWIKGIIEYFQGDLIRAVLQILIVAAFMWIWNLARTIPAIANILDFITKAVGQAIKFINDVFDSVTKWVEDLRRNIADSLRQMFGAMGDFGKQISSSILAQVDRLFGGLERQLARARFELTGEIDLVRKFTETTVTVFGMRFRLVPDEVRAYLLNYEKTHPAQAASQWVELSARANLPDPNAVQAPIGAWEATDELIADFQAVRAGRTRLPFDPIAELIADFQAVRAGTPPDLPDWPPEWFPSAPTPAPVAPGGIFGPRPGYIPADDWSLVLQTCPEPWNRALVAAIGWAETHWGQLGVGPQGYILGVGATDVGLDPRFQGLPAQLAWECPRLSTAFPAEGTISQDALAGYARDVRRTTDWGNWARNVWQQYVSLRRAFVVP